MPVNTLHYTDELTVRRVYALGRTISDLFDKFGLFYWTTGGTTLGIVRHGGLIPWDDDLDLCIRQQDENKLVDLSSELEKAGLSLKRSQPYAWKIYNLVDSVPVNNLNCSHRYPFCDIFVMRKARDWFELSDRSGRNAWPQERYSTDQVACTELRQFGNYLLRCPASPEAYLDQTYGGNWRDVGSTHFFDHRSGGNLRSTQFDITRDMFIPALPFQ